MSKTSVAHEDLPTGWRLVTDTNRWGQSSAVVFDEQDHWVAEAKDPETAIAIAMGNE